MTFWKPFASFDGEPGRESYPTTSISSWFLPTIDFPLSRTRSLNDRGLALMESDPMMRAASSALASPFGFGLHNSISIFNFTSVNRFRIPRPGQCLRSASGFGFLASLATFHNVKVRPLVRDVSPLSFVPDF
jgi:hypothetical protein